MSSKAMLNSVCKLQNWVLPVVFNMDCTIKLTYNELPLVIIGVTDAAQQLHVLSVSIVSNYTYAMYLRVVQGLKDLVSRLLPQVTFMLAYVMTNAEVAERKDSKNANVLPVLLSNAVVAFLLWGMPCCQLLGISGVAFLI
jgi:hypothetical protein